MVVVKSFSDNKLFRIGLDNLDFLILSFSLAITSVT
jgi:hypothetical protein